LDCPWRINEKKRRSREGLRIHYPVIEWEIGISRQYGLLFRNLKNEGKISGTNDLWIAATALTQDLTVVTRNLDEFSKVPGLEVVGY